MFISDNTNGNVYYGSTTLSLSQRLADHKQYFELSPITKRYITCFEILKNKNYSITLVEDVPCQRKEQLLMRERFYIENNPCVNKCIPLRTHKEYNDDHKVERYAYQKDYRQKHGQTSCPCGGTYLIDGLPRHMKTKRHIKYLDNVALETKSNENDNDNDSIDTEVN